jgi:hypothetical protein
MRRFNVDEVIAKGELDNFILGEGQLYQNKRPEEDYFRWSQLSDYYRSLPENALQRKQIEQTVIDLMCESDPIRISASLEIASLLGLRNIGEELSDLIFSLEESILDECVINSVSRAIVLLRLDHVAIRFIQRVVEIRKLESLFIAAVETLYDGRVTDSEHWVMSKIHSFFIQANTLSNDAIRLALKDAMAQSDRIRRVVKEYISNLGADDPDFSNLLSMVFADTE